MRIDHALKELFLEEGTTLFDRLGGAEVAQWVNVELPQTRAPRADLVAWLKDKSLFHLEFQSTNDPEMHWRQLEYYSLLCRRYKTEPRQVVLYLDDAPVRMKKIIRQNQLRFEYEIVDIRDWNGEELLASPSVGDSILAILCRTPDDKARVNAIARRVAALAPERRERALHLLLIISGMRGLTGEVYEEVKRMAVEVDPMKDKFWRSLVERGREEGIKEGRKEGIEEALEIMLTERFGPLPQWTRERIASAGRETLEVWLRRATTKPDLDSILA